MNFYTIFYKILFKFLKIKHGKNLKIYGKIFIENKKYCNLEIGNNVEIFPFVHLKFYKNTKIKINDNVKLDYFTRLVVANSSQITIKSHSKIGKSTVINAGANITIGEKNVIAQNCSINSSSHNFREKVDIQSQGYNHKEVILKNDIWLGANVIINPGTVINEHTVIGAGCNIKGHIEKNSIVKNDIKLAISNNEN